MENRPPIQEREQQPPLNQGEVLWAGDLCETPGKPDVSLCITGFMLAPRER